MAPISWSRLGREIFRSAQTWAGSVCWPQQQLGQPSNRHDCGQPAELIMRDARFVCLALGCGLEWRRCACQRQRGQRRGREELAQIVSRQVIGEQRYFGAAVAATVRNWHWPQSLRRPDWRNEHEQSQVQVPVVRDCRADEWRHNCTPQRPTHDASGATNERQAGAARTLGRTC